MVARDEDQLKGAVFRLDFVVHLDQLRREAAAWGAPVGGKVDEDVLPHELGNGYLPKGMFNSEVS